MSYRPGKNARRGKPATKVRGPSRPIDPRYAPGGPPRRRLDAFGISLLVVSGLALVVLVVILVSQNKGGQPSPSTSNGPTALPDMTQTAIAFATMTSPSVLPRITITDAKALYDANNVKIIDVRDAQFYNQGHITGAVNIPQPDVQSRLSEIPKTGNVILYCQ